jgi:hypothetical protein
LDIWIRRTPENVRRVWNALKRFHTPLRELKLEDLLTEDVIYFVGVPPQKLDILTSILGVEFDEAWPRRTTVEVDGQSVPVLGKAELIKAKWASEGQKI